LKKTLKKKLKIHRLNVQLNYRAFCKSWAIDCGFNSYINYFTNKELDKISFNGKQGYVSRGHFGASIIELLTWQSSEHALTNIRKIKLGVNVFVSLQYLSVSLDSFFTYIWSLCGQWDPCTWLKNSRTPLKWSGIID